MLWVKIFGLIGILVYTFISGMLEAKYWDAATKRDSDVYHLYRALQYFLGLIFMAIAIVLVTVQVCLYDLSLLRVINLVLPVPIIWFLIYRLGFVYIREYSIECWIPEWDYDIKLPFIGTKSFSYPLAGRWKTAAVILIVALVVFIIA